MQTTQWGKMKTTLDSYVGFDTIQEQIRKKSLKRGFELNIMVVGELVMEQIVQAVFCCTCHFMHRGTWVN